jgi:hypothetical protein
MNCVFNARAHESLTFALFEPLVWCVRLECQSFVSIRLNQFESKYKNTRWPSPQNLQLPESLLGFAQSSVLHKRARRKTYNDWCMHDGLWRGSARSASLYAWGTRPKKVTFNCEDRRACLIRLLFYLFLLRKFMGLTFFHIDLRVRTKGTMCGCEPASIQWFKWSIRCAMEAFRPCVTCEWRRACWLLLDRRWLCILRGRMLMLN